MGGDNAVGADAHIGPSDTAARDGGRQSAVPTGVVPAPALAALERLNAAGYEAYLVGGCVRDALLGREPGDWDITTSALPEQTEAVFAGERIIETGLKHGTVTVLLEGLPLEITTFRTEAGYADHRHPDAVAFSRSLEEDLARRDFTINAMAWCPVDTPRIRPNVRADVGIGPYGAPSPQGEGLVDPFGGQADLEARLIRCVGDPYKRFEEDALRILRALRFAAQLDFAIDPATAEAAFALRDTLELVSRERLAVELTKLLCGPGVRRIVTEYWPILAVPLPELAPMAGLDQRSPYHCYDVLEHSAVAAAAVPPDKITRWAALLHDAGKPACFTVDDAGRGHFYGHARPGAELARAALTRLRFDKDTVRRVGLLVELHDYPIDPPVAAHSVRHPEAPGDDNAAAEHAIRKLIGKLGEEDFFRLLDLKRADALAHHPDYRGRAAACDRLGALARELLAQEAVFSLKDLAVNGNDLLKLGFPKGPAVGKTLNALLEAVLSGELPNEKTALLDAARSRL
ncbi:MAG: HD domain-containing protein [Oscillospiraceae bacterium]|nr:HD domain-containing protein [Oscillospiraceae bacterium]